MSDDRDREAGPSARLLSTLIWAGVGLAPVAVLVVLVGGGQDSVRFAVVLVAVCVVLIGTSILLRNDPILLGIDTEDRGVQEAEAVRTELRAEFAAAARSTYQRVQSLQDEVGHLRGAQASARPEPRLATGARAAAVAVVPAAVAVVPAAAAVVPAAVVASVSAGPAPKSGYADAAAGRSTALGLPAGGRATVTPSAPGWPETELPPSRDGQAISRRAAVSAGAAVPPPGHPVAASGPVPRQRGAAGVPPMTPVFRPPTSPAPRAQYPSSGSAVVRPGSGGVQNQDPHLGAPRPGQYGSSHRGNGDPGYAASPEWSADEPSYGGQPGWGDRGDRSWPDPEDHSFWTDPDGQTGRADDGDSTADPGRWTGDEPSQGHQLEWPDEEPSYGGQPGPLPPAPGPIYGRAEPRWADDDPGYGGQPDWESQRDQPGRGVQADHLGWVGQDDSPWVDHPQPRVGHDEPRVGHDEPWVGHDEPWVGQDEPWVGQDDQSSEDSRPVWPDEPDDTPDRPHKRRADVTAVDLGYTGRRSRPGHARPDSR